MLLWRPVADHWRGADGGTAGAVLAAAHDALAGAGYRPGIPAPSDAEVAALTRAGNALNIAVRERYMRGGETGSVATAAAAVLGAAQALGRGWSAARPAQLCTGPRDRLVHLRCDPLVHAAMVAAAEANALTLGAWVRDACAAAVGEHQARRPAAGTRTARSLCGRITGLLVQAADVAADRGESAAVVAAEDAIAGAVERMASWGSRR